MSFPVTKADARTDDNFRHPEKGVKLEEEHIKENSILKELKIDMILDFPTSDPLHLLELGIMKR